jgi:hypothetical protein
VFVKQVLYHWSHIFVLIVLRMAVSPTIYSGWRQTEIFPLLASLVARITDVHHQHLAPIHFIKLPLHKPRKGVYKEKNHKPISLMNIK